MTAMRFVDAHNHLQDERFAGRQDDLLATCRASGIARMVVNGSCEADWPAVLDLAQRHPDLVIPSLGLHPWYVPERSPRWLDTLARLARASGAAIGEIGLDRWKRDLPWDAQEDCFAAQLRLAAELNRPVSIHCLKAWGRLAELLEREPRPACGFILHSFGGSSEMIERLAPLGAYFSLPGAFARPGREHKAAVFLRVPPDRLLIETDAPDQKLPDTLDRHPLQAADGQRLNHPANLHAVYNFAAALLGEPVETITARVAANLARLFGP